METAVRRPNPRGRRHLRRRSAFVVAGTSASRSSRLDRRKGESTTEIQCWRPAEGTSTESKLLGQRHRSRPRPQPQVGMMRCGGRRAHRLHVIGSHARPRRGVGLGGLSQVDGGPGSAEGDRGHRSGRVRSRGGQDQITT
jgi:hypothetical protein